MSLRGERNPRFHYVTRCTSYYNSANLCPSVRLSICPSISTETVRTVHFALGQCVARSPTMCLFFLSLYGYGQVIQLNDFVWCSLAFIANVVAMPTVSQEIFIPQLIARGLPFNQKLHLGYRKRYTKLCLTPKK